MYVLYTHKAHTHTLKTRPLPHIFRMSKMNFVLIRCFGEKKINDINTAAEKCLYHYLVSNYEAIYTEETEEILNKGMKRGDS